MSRSLPSVSASGVTVVIPVHNGEQWLVAVLDSILEQAGDLTLEIIAVEDGGGDRSPEILARYAAAGHLTIVEGPRRGAAAALNAGFRRATHPIVCQVDQDVILRPGWMRILTSALANPEIAAAQGWYEAPADASLWVRVMGLDLRWRYHRTLTRDVNHVCTGNTAYRVSALAAIGFFDESLGYGYDNDVSYRLRARGHRLVICPAARSIHQWRDGWRAYLRQQYGFGYGRLDLVAKHRRRLAGDDVSPLWMMLHAPLFAAALLLLAIGAGLAIGGFESAILFSMAVLILAALVIERFAAGARAAMTFADPAGWWFVPVHLMRDLAWVAAVVMWSIRRLRGVAAHPSHSMHPRPATPESRRLERLG